MISKVLSTIGIAFVASLLLVGCDEAAQEASKPEPAKQEEKSAAAGSSSQQPVEMGGSLKDEAQLSEEEKKQLEMAEKLHKATDCGGFDLEMAEKLHKATDCGGFDQTCTHKQEVNLYAIKDEKAEKAGTATLTRTNDGRQPGGGLWSKLKKKDAE